MNVIYMCDASHCAQYLPLLLAFAGGSVSTPAQIIVQQYFTQRRALAAGIVSTGFSVASLSTAPLLRLCINHYGWRGALIIMAAINLQALFCACLLRPPPESASAEIVSSAIKTTERETINNELSDKEGAYGNNCEGSAEHVPSSHIRTKSSGYQCKSFFKAAYNSLGLFLLKNKAFSLLLFSIFPIFFGATTYFTYGINRAIHQGVDKIVASFVNSALGCGSLVGRLLTGLVGNLKCTNRNVQLAVTALLSGVVTMLSSFTGSSVELHLVFGFLFGLSFGKGIYFINIALVLLCV